MLQEPESGRSRTEWHALYRVGAAASLLVVVLSVVDVGLSSMPGTSAAAPGSLDAAAWLELLQANWFAGIRNLGIFNVATATLSLPIFAAIAAALWPRVGVLLALAAMLLVVGVAVYVSNNNALALLSLSHAYAAAPDEATRSTIIGTGRAMLFIGEDLTPGTYFGFLYTELAGLLLAVAVFRSGIFGRVLPAIATLGYLGLIVFSTLAAFVPSIYQWSVIVGAAAGLPMIVWYLGIAFNLFRLARAHPGHQA